MCFHLKIHKKREIYPKDKKNNNKANKAKINKNENNILNKIAKDKEARNDKLDPVKQYEKYCKDLIFIEDDKVTVKVNQKFAEVFLRNYTIPPEYWEDFPTLEWKNEEIELIETRTFYPYSIGACGGYNHKVFVFKANSTGNFKIKFSDHPVEVKVGI